MSTDDSSTHLSRGNPVDGRESALTRRALYYTPPNSFTFSLPKIPIHRFLVERDRALSPEAPTGLTALDLSRELASDTPSTTPLMLMRYARLGPNEPLTAQFKASTEIYYV